MERLPDPMHRKQRVVWIGVPQHVEISKVITMAFALFFILVSGLLGTLGGRLQAAGLWAGKALTAPEASLAMPRGIQDAITHGWPSTVGLLSSASPYLAGVAGFLESWWAGPLAFVAALSARRLLQTGPTSPALLEWYLARFVEHALRREADFRAKGDLTRADAASELAADLERLLGLYIGTGTVAPTLAVAREAPFGNEEYLLHRR